MFDKKKQYRAFEISQTNKIEKKNMKKGNFVKDLIQFNDMFFSSPFFVSFSFRLRGEILNIYISRFPFDLIFNFFILFHTLLITLSFPVKA